MARSRFSHSAPRTSDAWDSKRAAAAAPLRMRREAAQADALVYVLIVNPAVRIMPIIGRETGKPVYDARGALVTELRREKSQFTVYAPPARVTAELKRQFAYTGALRLVGRAFDGTKVYQCKVARPLENERDMQQQHGWDAPYEWYASRCAQDPSCEPWCEPEAWDTDMIRAMQAGADVQ